jgi:cytochrome c biogenesis protein CcmG/thiol:disulfide interchange protein DsbE
MTPRRVLVLVAATALLVAGCEEEREAAPRRPAPQVPADNATQAPLLPTYADALPTMGPATFERLLGQLEGTPVLVNFWGSWCPPCREEMPRLVQAHHEFGDRVQFLGVDIMDSRGEAVAFMEEFGMTFPSVFDVPDEIKAALGHLGQPLTLFYEADGDVSFAWAGPISEDRLLAQLRAITA